MAGKYKVMGRKPSKRYGNWDSLYYIEIDDSRVQGWVNRAQQDGLIERLMDEEIEKIANETADEMAGLAPVDTGHLRDTLRARNSVARASNMDWVIRNGTPYGVRQNFEHATQSHFMTIPAERALDELPKRIDVRIGEWFGDD